MIPRNCSKLIHTNPHSSEFRYHNFRFYALNHVEQNVEQKKDACSKNNGVSMNITRSRSLM